MRPQWQPPWRVSVVVAVDGGSGGGGGVVILCLWRWKERRNEKKMSVCCPFGRIVQLYAPGICGAFS